MINASCSHHVLDKSPYTSWHGIIQILNVIMENTISEYLCLMPEFSSNLYQASGTNESPTDVIPMGDISRAQERPNMSCVEESFYFQNMGKWIVLLKYRSGIALKKKQNPGFHILPDVARVFQAQYVKLYIKILCLCKSLSKSQFAKTHYSQKI